jgi:hypothetical protein
MAGTQSKSLISEMVKAFSGKIAAAGQKVGYALAAVFLLPFWVLALPYLGLKKLFWMRTIRRTVEQVSRRPRAFTRN